MAINDKIMATLSGLNYVDNRNIPIYNVEIENDSYKVDKYGVSTNVKHIGFVKNGTTGTIVGNPVKAYRNTQVETQYTAQSGGGLDFVMLHLVDWDYYGKKAWICQDHFKLL